MPLLPPPAVWRALTEPALLARWLMENDIRPEVGHRFTFRAPPVAGWDGVVHCEVLEVDAPRRLRYTWRGGADDIQGYGTRIDTVVTWTLTFCHALGGWGSSGHAGPGMGRPGVNKGIVARALAAGALVVTALVAVAGASPNGGAGQATAHPAKAAKAPNDGLTPLDPTSLRQAMRKAKGSDLFVHLWASWCGPCLEELPDIDRLARQARARGATFLSVSLDDPRRGAHVLDVLHRRAPNLTRFVARLDDPDKLAELFAGEWDGSIPALFVYDRAGHLRASFVGQLENADIRRMLADITVAPPGPRAH